MKLQKTLKLILMISVIVLISIISFVGIYVQKQNRMENILKEYKLAKNLSGYRMIELKVSDETENSAADESELSSEETNESSSTNSINEVTSSEEQTSNSENIVETSENISKDTLNKENYKKSKEIIAKRLEGIGVDSFTIRENSENGDIIIELPEDNNTDRIAGELNLDGKFEIIDNDTSEVLMTNNDIKSAKAGYGRNSSGNTVIFMNIEFNKEGKEKFRNITNTYVKSTSNDNAEDKNETTNATTNETVDETSKDNTSSETTTKEVAIKLDDATLLTTHFDEEVTNGILQLSFGSSSSSTDDEMIKSYNEALSLASILNAGKLPLKYEVKQNKYIKTDITVEQIKITIIIGIVVFAVASLYAIFKYKAKGILTTISLIGYVAVLLIALRYFNVEISVGGIATILFSTAISYIISIYILKSKNIAKAVGKSFVTLIPTIILAIVLTFANIPIGAVLFWGVTLALLYHISVTNLMLN